MRIEDILEAQEREATPTVADWPVTPCGQPFEPPAGPPPEPSGVELAAAELAA
jgi:hypothetical protein